MERFWKKVQKTATCWNWTAAQRNGYGVIKINKKLISTHRLSYEIHKGSIPDGLLICHSCDNRLCVNPEHLFLGSYSDNTIDAVNKGIIIISKGVDFLPGHKVKKAFLQSKEDIDFIKESIKSRGLKTLKQLSIELNVKYQLLRDINCGRVYKYSP